MKRLAAGLAVVFLLSVMSGCGGRTVITKDGTGKVTRSGDKVTYQGSDDEGKTEVNVSSSGTLSLPAGYPEDLVPIPDGAKITVGGKNEVDGKFSYGITYLSPRSPQDLYQYYQDKLKDLQEPSSLQINDGYMISGQKDGNSICVTINAAQEAGQKSSVYISISPE